MGDWFGHGSRECFGYLEMPRWVLLMTTPRQLLLEKAGLTDAERSHNQIGLIHQRRLVTAATEKAVAVTLEAVGDLAEALESIMGLILPPPVDDGETDDSNACNEATAALARYRELRAGED